MADLKVQIRVVSGAAILRKGLDEMSNAELLQAELQIAAEIAVRAKKAKEALDPREELEELTLRELIDRWEDTTGQILHFPPDRELMIKALIG